MMANKLNMQPLSEKVAENYDAGAYGAGHRQIYRNIRTQTLSCTIARHFGENRAIKILDVGCGTGVALGDLASLPARHELHGIDFSESMLEKAREKAAALVNPPTLAHGSAYEIPFGDGEFDMVYSSRCIHLFSHEDKKHVLREIYRVTRPGGVIAVEFYARLNYLLHWYLMPWRRRRDKASHFAHYPTAREVREVMGRPFEIVPMRLIGSRLLYALCGDALLTRLTSAARGWPLSVLKDEYFAITTK